MLQAGGQQVSGTKISKRKVRTSVLGSAKDRDCASALLAVAILPL